MNADRKNQKRREAAERQAHWASLTPTQQLEALAKRPGASIRQVERIVRSMPVMSNRPDTSDDEWE